MEIVLIRHGQPEWVKGGEYTVDPGLTEIGKEQAEKSASVFAANSIDEIWVSPLSRAQETLKPFEEKNIAPNIKTFEWLREALDDDEKKLIGESEETILHEILHTLGAPPKCGKNLDPENKFHVADSNKDILYK